MVCVLKFDVNFWPENIHRYFKIFCCCSCYVDFYFYVDHHDATFFEFRFIRFQSNETAQNTIEYYNGTKFQGQHVTVSMAKACNRPSFTPRCNLMSANNKLERIVFIKML